MVPKKAVFTFLVVPGIKVAKKKLRTWQNMAWKAFLLFGDLRKNCPVYASKWLRRVLFLTSLVIVEISLKKAKHGLEGFSVVC
jgi:hypothetical protein